MTIRNVDRRLALGLTHGWLSDEARRALPATAGWRRRRFIELVRTLEIGPLGRGATRSTIVVRIYKDTARRNRFFPLVFRRMSYELRRSYPRRDFHGEIETLDPSFAPDSLVRTSGDAVLDAVLKRIRAA